MTDQSKHAAVDPTPSGSTAADSPVHQSWVQPPPQLGGIGRIAAAFEGSVKGETVRAAYLRLVPPGMFQMSRAEQILVLFGTIDPDADCAEVAHGLRAAADKIDPPAAVTDFPALTALPVNQARPEPGHPAWPQLVDAQALLDLYYPAEALVSALALGDGADEIKARLTALETALDAVEDVLVAEGLLPRVPPTEAPIRAEAA